MRGSAPKRRARRTSKVRVGASSLSATCTCYHTSSLTVQRKRTVKITAACPRRTLRSPSAPATAAATTTTTTMHKNDRSRRRGSSLLSRGDLTVIELSRLERNSLADRARVNGPEQCETAYESPHPSFSSLTHPHLHYQQLLPHVVLLGNAHPPPHQPSAHTQRIRIQNKHTMYQGGKRSQTSLTRHSIHARRGRFPRGFCRRSAAITQPSGHMAHAQTRDSD
jgi:hypothetical protein